MDQSALGFDWEYLLLPPHKKTPPTLTRILVGGQEMNLKQPLMEIETFPNPLSSWNAGNS